MINIRLRDCGTPQYAAFKTLQVRPYPDFLYKSYIVLKALVFRIVATFSITNHCGLTVVTISANETESAARPPRFILVAGSRKILAWRPPDNDSRRISTHRFYGRVNIRQILLEDGMSKVLPIYLYRRVPLIKSSSNVKPCGFEAKRHSSAARKEINSGNSAISAVFSNQNRSNLSVPQDLHGKR